MCFALTGRYYLQSPQTSVKLVIMLGIDALSGYTFSRVAQNHGRTPLEPGLSVFDHLITD